MFVTAAIVRAAEARFGIPREVQATYEISRDELTMVRASQRDGRAHDVTIFAFYARRLAVIAKPNYPPGAYRAPGGALRPGEAMGDGAAREALEETGLVVAINRYVLRVAVRFTAAGDAIDWTTHVFRAAAADERLEPRDQHEIREARWSSMHELTGPIDRVLRESGRGLFRYRADLHCWAADCMEDGR